MNTPPILWAVWHCWINIKPQKQLLANCICVVALLDQHKMTEVTAGQLQLCLGHCWISVKLHKLLLANCRCVWATVGSVSNYISYCWPTAVAFGSLLDHRQIMCPVCRMLQYPANRIRNPQLHTRTTT